MTEKISRMSDFSRAMAALGPFEPQPRIAVAVSGGGDSMALAFLLAQWLREQGGQMTALTVDHGLRAAAKDEAVQVKNWLAAHNIDHETLTWKGSTPGSRIQAAARDARYELMTQWCRNRGILHLAVAHTLEDQGETIWMRRQRQDSGDGLAGMAGRRYQLGVQLLRPLLNIRRADLRAYLLDRGQSWIEDPSNLDARFERVRARAALDGEEIGNILRTGAQAAAIRSTRNQELCQRFADLVTTHPAGHVTFRRPGFFALAKQQQIDFLRRAILVIGLDDYPATFSAVTRLLGDLRVDKTATLAHCQLRVDRQTITIARENRHLAPPIVMPASGSVIWDRFIVAGPRTLGDKISAFRREGIQDKGLLDVWVDIPKWIWPTLPARWRDDQINALPAFAGSRAELRAEIRLKQPLCTEF